MKKIIILFTLLLSLSMTVGSRAATIGTWKAYMAYHDVQDIQKAGHVLFVLASDNLYSYNTNDGSILTYDKSTLLSDCGIKLIAWCQSAKRLVAVYENGNIDLVELNDNVVNVSDYYMKSIVGDKTINDIYVYGRYAYLSTGMGILKLNVQDAEISDFYKLDFNVNYTYIENNRIYAASNTKGTYSALLTSNLLDSSNWTYTTPYTAKTKTIDPELLETVKTLNPGGPKYNNFGFMRFTNNKLYTSGSGYGRGLDLLRPGTVQVLEGDEWDIFQDELDTITGSRYIDVACVEVDPFNLRHVLASGRTGIYEFIDGKFTNRFTDENSPLVDAFPPAKNYIIMQTMKYDNEGNLWTIQSFSQNLFCLTKQGEWKTFELNIPGYYNTKHMMFDSQELLWFVNDHWEIPAVYCYQPSTQVLKTFSNLVNQDGTVVNSNAVQHIAEDKNGDIWVATSLGPLLLERSQINEENYYFTQVKVPRNDGTNYADYLMSGIDITGIAIDGGNRKWFATRGNGVYLISADNMTQLQHFTAENSCLLSDDVESIAINDDTGEVFFGTNKGLCSYMSDATATSMSMDKNNVYAYPNPVDPDYSGLITVVGLTMDADVKITTTNGVLVAQGRSNGGSFTWDGTDLNGKRVASGVYMVQTATSTGSKGTVCKIAIIR